MVSPSSSSLQITRRRTRSTHYSTHLLDSHLVLQWVEESEQDVDALRRKGGVGYGGGAELPGKKWNLVIGGDDQEEDSEATSS